MARTGLGFDMHPLVSGRPLKLGGVTVPFDRGLSGHSDGDALLHAVADAILGSLAAGDLGERFPPTDPRWAGADSAALLRDCVSFARSRGWRPAQLDSTILAEVPRLAPYLPAMRARLAELLELPPDWVSVKATSPESMGSLGRGDGIAALALVVLEPA